MGNKITAQDVAYYFLDKAHDSITNMKLQKLLFFAQEEYLYEYKKTLFDDELLAWEHGPIVHPIYSHFKSFKKSPIMFVPDSCDMYKFNKKILAILDYVWLKYGNKEAFYLRSLSHLYKSWKTSYNGHNSKNNIIDTNILLSDRQQAEKYSKKDIKTTKKAIGKLGF